MVTWSLRPYFLLLTAGACLGAAAGGGVAEREAVPREAGASSAPGPEVVSCWAGRAGAAGAWRTGAWPGSA